MNLQQSYVDAPLLASLTSNRGLWQSGLVRSYVRLWTPPLMQAFCRMVRHVMVRCCRLFGLSVRHGMPLDGVDASLPPAPAYTG